MSKRQLQVSRQQFDAVVFTLDSLQRCLYQVSAVDRWLAELDIQSEHDWGVSRNERGRACYLLDENAVNAQSIVVIALKDNRFPDGLNRRGIRVALERIHYMAVQASRKQTSFPHAWSQYTVGNLLQVFAYHVTLGAERIVAQIRDDDKGRRNLYVCGITTPSDQIDLTLYRPDNALFEMALEAYPEVAFAAAERLAGGSPADPTGVIDLEAVGFGAVTRGKTYSAWLPSLTSQQKRFIEAPLTRAIKLRGPAGTGKTLAMELKVLRHCYDAKNAGEAIRVLYATHSWSMADQVDKSLRELDEHGVVDSMVEVFPLLSLAEARVGAGRELSLMGDDSFSGQEAQLRYVRDLLEHLKRSDWIAFRGTVAPEFRDRVEAVAGTAEANLFLWDLSQEFASVLAANGIFPGIAALDKYRQIERRPWMMPIRNETELSFVYEMYKRFVNALVREGHITSDQLTTDFLGFLATFRWHAERSHQGYDVIFVDEFHLFNAQEQMVFHNLVKNPDLPPAIFMALDPRQSPTEAYTEFAAPAVSRGDLSRVEESLRGAEAVDLDRVFRFTPEIHRFLLVLDEYYPTLGLGDDWGVSVADVTSDRAPGAVPTFKVMPSEEQEMTAAVETAVALHGQGKRVALLCLERSALVAYQSFVDNAAAPFRTVESREDADRLKYSKRSIVLAQPTSVAGLQFEAVVLAGCRATYSQYDPYQSYGLRRFLSDIYLGASRAENILQVFATGSGGDFPPVIEAAIDRGVLRPE